MARSSKPETLNPMRSPMPPRSQRRKSSSFCAGRTVTKKRRSSSTINAAAASSSEKETPTVVFTEGSPFPNNDSGDKTATTTVVNHPALSQKLFHDTSFPDFDENSSPGSKAGQSLEEEDDDADEFDNDAASKDEEEGGGGEDHWSVRVVQSAKQIRKHNPTLCHVEGCGLVACTIWVSRTDPTEQWYYCLDCQEAHFGGWPVKDGTGKSELPMKEMSNDWSRAVIEHCSNQDDPKMPDLPKPACEEDDSSDASSSPSGNDSQELTTTTQDDGSEPDMRQLNVFSLCQQILDCGVASVCRLRKLFPSHFFQKQDFEGTSVTLFHKENIKRIAYQLDDDDESYDSDEDESIVKNIQAKTQENLSPLTSTLMSQKHYRKSSTEDEDRVVYTDKEIRLALEALLLIRWMERDGVGSLLKKGNLARVVFGILAPSGESQSDELLESYSFDISFSAPDNTSDVDFAEAKSGTGSFFQNLNGFKAGPTSLSQLVPSMTQATSAFSQASCYDDGNTQASSQHYTQSQMSQTFIASMSQSIRHKVNKNQSIKIPSNRCFSLRVEFVKSVQRQDLPSRLKQYASATSRSPVPGNHGTMRVTPLGRIRESGYSGLSVDIEARSRIIEEKDRDGNDNTDCSRTKASNSQDYHPLTQAEYNENDDDMEESYAENEDDSKENKLRNHDFAIGSTCFGRPMGLDDATYAPCKILDHRGKCGGKSKFKVKVFVDNEVLDMAGKTKQWLSLNRLVSSSVVGKVESALRLNQIGLLQHYDAKAISKKFGVDTALVKCIEEEQIGAKSNR